MRPGRRFDRAYINLVDAVEGRLPAGVELVGAHSCVFKGQRFGHVILKYRGQLVSVLVTSLEMQDQAGSTGLKEVVAEAQLDGFHLAHFETTRHAVFVVSNLSKLENASITRAIEPSVLKPHHGRRASYIMSQARTAINQSQKKILMTALAVDPTCDGIVTGIQIKARACDIAA